MITMMTKQLSFEDIKPKRKKRYEEILDRLMGGAKTAKEISRELFDLGITNTPERNTSAPRLTELVSMGLVRVIDKKKCEYTGKKVAVYEITPKGIEQRYSKYIPRVD